MDAGSGDIKKWEQQQQQEREDKTWQRNVKDAYPPPSLVSDHSSCLSSCLSSLVLLSCPSFSCLSCPACFYFLGICPYQEMVSRKEGKEAASKDGVRCCCQRKQLTSTDTSWTKRETNTNGVKATCVEVVLLVFLFSLQYHSSYSFQSIKLSCCYLV